MLSIKIVRMVGISFVFAAISISLIFSYQQYKIVMQDQSRTLLTLASEAGGADIWAHATLYYDKANDIFPTPFSALAASTSLLRTPIPLFRYFTGQSDISSIATDAANKYLAIGMQDGVIQVVDAENGTIFRVLHPNATTGPIFKMRFSNNGEYLYAMSDLEQKPVGVASLASSNSFRRWSLETGEWVDLPKRASGQEMQFDDFVIIENAGVLVVQSKAYFRHSRSKYKRYHGLYHVVDLRSNQIVETLGLEIGLNVDLSVSYDPIENALVSNERQARRSIIWKIGDWTNPRIEILPNDQPGYELIGRVPGQDRFILSNGKAFSITRKDRQGTHLIYTLPFNLKNSIRFRDELQFMSKGERMIVSDSKSNTIEIWALSGSRGPRQDRIVISRSDPSSSFAGYFLSNNNSMILTYDRQGMIVGWVVREEHAQTLSMVDLPDPFKGIMTDFRSSDHSELNVGWTRVQQLKELSESRYGGGFIFFWTKDTSSTVHWDPQENIVNDMKYSPDGTYFATASWSGTKIWRINAQKPTLIYDLKTELKNGRWTRPEYSSAAIEFTDDSQKLIISGKGGRLTTFDLASGRASLAKSNAHQSTIYELRRVNRANQLISASKDGEIILWQLPNWTPAGGFRGSIDSIDLVKESVSVSADGRVLAFRNGTYIDVWRLTDRSLVSKVGPFSSGLGALHLNFDGSLVFADTDEGILVSSTLGKAGAFEIPFKFSRIRFKISENGSHLQANVYNHLVLFPLATEIGTPVRTDPLSDLIGIKLNDNNLPEEVSPIQFANARIRMVQNNHDIFEGSGAFGRPKFHEFVRRAASVTSFSTR